ncbi:MAG TPA: cation:proton antiporter [Rhizomicrobium sp.]|jgi:Kef-type K+ transport system membrane component KefB/nucleotide-binding universal stress UspA family protein
MHYKEGKRADAIRLAAIVVASALILFTNHALAAGAKAGGEGLNSIKEPIFVAEIVLLLVTGRLLGEFMVRLKQPSVMGMLLAGILLGHSVLGALWPGAEKFLFPTTSDQKGMIDGLSKLGILMLLLLTGMETDLKLVRKVGGAAVSISLTGIAVPFLCGFTLGQFLPDSILPDASHRLVTSLFLGTALSISSIKIVAMVVREMNFMRRNLGQIIVASAIMEDSIGWIIIAITLGIAQAGRPDIASVAKIVVGITLFLGFSFTLGRRIVFSLIRWTNDNFQSEFAVVTMILVIMGSMALITAAIGVQTVLGAFIAGVLVGESPILTKHIDDQLRGVITALFMPVFFGLSGISADLTILAKPQMLGITLIILAIASLGKFGGAFLGGKLGGLSNPESLALGCGMNARGSTEVIVATIGLSMGALTQNLFTMIVTMALITTTAMPPMLRKALVSLPISKSEKERLEREALDEKGFIPKVERILLAVDESAAGRIAARVAGTIAGARGMPITIVEVDKSEAKAQAATEVHERAIKDSAKESAAVTAEITDEEKPRKVDITRQEKGGTTEEKVAEAVKKGFGLMFVGIAKSRTSAGEMTAELTRIVADFEGPIAVLVCRNCPDPDFLDGADILLPVNGTDVSRRGAETAFVMARPMNASLTALYVSAGENAKRNSLARRNEEAVLKDITELASRYDLDIKTAVASDRATDKPIVRDASKHDLIVMGVSRRPGQVLFFGNTAAALMKDWDGPILFVAT